MKKVLKGNPDSFNEDAGYGLGVLSLSVDLSKLIRGE